MSFLVSIVASINNFDAKMCRSLHILIQYLGSAVAQWVEPVTPGQEVLGSILAAAP